MVISSFRTGKLFSWASSRRAVTRKTCCCTSTWDRRKWLEVSSNYFVCELSIGTVPWILRRWADGSVQIHSQSATGTKTRQQTRDSRFHGHRTEICRALVLLCVLRQISSDFVCHLCVCVSLYMLICGWVVECRGFDAMHICAVRWFLVNERKFGCICCVFVYVWTFCRQKLHIGSD